MTDKKGLVTRAVHYLKSHPEEVFRAAKNARKLRFGLPLVALSTLATELGGKKGPRDIELEAVPPGFRVQATVDLMGNDVRASALVFVDLVRMNAEELRFEIRVRDVSLELLRSAPDSPVATLLKSGALDLSKPGNLVAYMPKRPPMLIEAKDDKIVLDLKKHPLLSGPKADKLLDLVTALVGIRTIETDWEHLDVALRAFPEGVFEAVEALRRLR